MTPAVPQLHAVTDDRIARLPRLVDLASAIAHAGAVAIHLRAPALPGVTLLELARRLADALTGTRSLLLLNDRPDVARLAAAAGVHLPEQGLPVSAARRLLGTEALVGRSIHSAEDARRASSESADYVFLGPIWPTASHPHRAPLGVEAIAQAAPVRVIAIGGVTAERVRACREAGAYGVAAISAIWDVPDPGAVVREMLLSLQETGTRRRDAQTPSGF